MNIIIKGKNKAVKLGEFVIMRTFVAEFIYNIWSQLFNHYKQTEIIKLIYSYRYGSLLITSVFYLVDGSVSLLVFKLVVVISLYVVARLITDMYVKASSCTNKLKAIILLETFVITLLLVPTGGVDSPFVWYALNPVLVAAWYLTPYFCWSNLIFYISSALGVSVAVFHKGHLDDVIIDNTNKMLVFILITLLVQLLAAFMKRLQLANVKQQESLEQIMSLYKLIEAFSNEYNLKNFFLIYTDYVARLTKSNLSFFWHYQEQNQTGEFYTHISINKRMQLAIDEELKFRLKSIDGRNKIIELNIAESTFYVVLVKSARKLYGGLGIEIHKNKVSEISLEKHLMFLSDLSSIILERLAIEATNDKLIILEERNRIANEIHDSVSQRLFSINCALHLMKANFKDLSNEELNEQLDLISNSANMAKVELRKSIYSLSSQKGGERIFFSSIKSYLTDLGKLNKLKINVDLIGDEDLLNAKVKKYLYRVICEATGNSVKHSKCSVINVHMEIDSQYANLLIGDNGAGFNYGKLDNDAGLGLSNMKHNIHTLGGEFVLYSKEKLGTKIMIKIPINSITLQEEGDEYYAY